MASTKTDYAEIQQNEIDVLRSIFMEDFVEEEVKPGAWNKKTDRAFRLTLRPTSGEDGELSTTIRVTLPATYPKTIPHCQVTYSDGVLDATRSVIDSLVKTKPRALLGSEMIFELATSITEVLEDALVAKPSPHDVPALDEERALKEAEVQEKAQQAKEELIKQQNEAIEEEERLLMFMVEKEQARMGRRSGKSANEAASSEATGEASQILAFDQDIRTKTPTGASITFRTVAIKSKIRFGPLTEVSIVHPLNLEGDHIPFLALKECIIPPRKLEEKLKKGIQNLESNLETLIQLPAHPSITNPLSFRIQKEMSGSKSNAGGWKVSILTALASRGSMRDFLDTLGTLDVKNVRSWAIQIIEGLDFYHRHNIVHADIRPENILLEPSETGLATVKLADGLFQNELHMLKDETASKFSTSSSAYWIAPEVSGNHSSTPTTSKDIWDLGVLILQMIFGMDVKRLYASPNALMDAFDLSQSFDDFISAIFTADQRSRPTAFNLLTHGFLRTDDPIIDRSSSLPASMMVASTPNALAKHIRMRHDSAHAFMTYSRYANDFVEAGRLGKGGFGEVVRARNKLDGRFYAIKKITSNSSSALSGVLSELHFISRMNHPNVVRYYGSWVEEEGESKTPSDTSESDDDDPSVSVVKSLAISYGHSGPGLDFISQPSGADIQFGYDTDDDDHNSEAVADEEEEADDNDNIGGVNGTTPYTGRRRRSSVMPPSKSTLYIQMEYCEKHTLRDLIRGDLHSNSEECWRLFRQILEGLVHVHGHGIIHRDLKPENVFIDNSNNVRLGDFGLAKTGDYQSIGKSTSTGNTNPSLTMSIGTSVYVAPEVRSSGGGKYDARADMYSLGIILFEMSYPLKTSMERADILGRLRQVSCILPPAFEEPEKSLQAEIISSLVKHQVAERPHSLDLLRSGKVPVPVEDESVRAAVQGILDVGSPYHDKLLHALFTRKQADELGTEHYKYDIMAISSTPKPTDLLLQQFVKERITDVFRHHGAIETSRPLLLPSSSYYDTSVALLDLSGSLIQLRNDLILPNARLIAMKSPTIRKTYAFGEVYRAGLAGSYPRATGEVDFDIISYDNFDLALREAEVVKAIDEILDSFPSLSQSKMCYHFGHSLLLDGILAFCDIPKDKWYRVKEVLSRLHVQHWTWPAIRDELRAPGVAVASTSLDELQRFDWRDTYDRAIPRLRTILQNTDGLESTFTHLDAVLTYLTRFAVKRKIYINPLSSVNEKFYRGHFLFQCLFDTHKRSVLAGGGRYDKLIQQHRPNSKFEDRHAVGFNLGWERIVNQTLKLSGKSANSFLRKGEEQSQDLSFPRRCEVIVDSADPAALRTVGIKIVQELWANKISAELSIDADLKKGIGNQHKEEDSDGHCWAVLIKQDETLKVRNMVKTEETEVRSSDLVGWLRSEIRERDKAEGRCASLGPPTRHLHHSESTGNSNDREPDVRVLISQTKSKKTNRRNIVEDAYSRSQDLVQGFLDGPVIAIETKDELFEGLRSTRLSETESWRRFIQNAPAPDRAYLSELHSLLQDVAGEVKDTHKGCFIYNFRSKACLHYDLWKAS